jgi:hypothetical protein
MDDVRFDALTRSLGHLGPRRGALKAVAALVAGSVATRFTARPAAALACTSSDPCPERLCKRVACEGGQCVYSPIEECCTGDADCDDGNVCTRDTCDLSSNHCEYTPRPEGTECGDKKSCRNGRCRCARLQEPCRKDGFLPGDCCNPDENLTVCRPSPLGDTRCCRWYDSTCTENSQCCSGACRSSVCCIPAGEACDIASGRCCGSAVCNKGICCTPAAKSTTCQGKCGTVTNNCGQRIDCGCCPLQAACTDANQCCQNPPTKCASNGAKVACCRGSGYGCTGNDDCCGAGLCKGGSRPTCCQPLQATCGRSGDCCGAAICRSGRCCADRAGAACKGDADCCGARICFRPDPNSAGACT